MPAAPIIPWDDAESALLVNATRLFSDVDPTVKVQEAEGLKHGPVQKEV